MDPSADCSICLDPAAAKNPSACPSCAVVCCYPCIETHLLASDTTDAACPGCRVHWTQTFLYSILKPAFRTGPYQKLREKVLFDREKARLPEAQEDARRYKAALSRRETIGDDFARAGKALREVPEMLALKKAEASYKRSGEYARMARELRTLDDAYVIAVLNAYTDPARQAKLEAILGSRAPPPGTKTYTCTVEELDAIRQFEREWLASEEHERALARRNTLRDNIERVRDEQRALLETWRVSAIDRIADIRAPFERAVGDLARERRDVLFTVSMWGIPFDADSVVPTKRTFTMKCVKADCEGFLSAEYTCGLCDVKVCEHCHVPDHSSHVCDPTTVATIKQIRKEAHPCPTCAALISKIDGCDQMYCTQCHTAFSWNTGRIETGVVHNPHYFQYMRETGQAVPRRHNPGFACDAVRDIGSTLVMLMSDFHLAESSVSVAVVDTVLQSYRHVLHVREVDLRAYRQQQVTYLDQEWRRILRVKRLLNVLDDAGWKTALQREEKKHYKITAWVHLLEMYTTVSLETFARIKVNSPVEDVRRIYAEYESAKAYTIEQAKAIAKVFGCVVPKGLRSEEA